MSSRSSWGTYTTGLEQASPTFSVVLDTRALFSLHVSSMKLGTQIWDVLLFVEKYVYISSCIVLYITDNNDLLNFYNPILFVICSSTFSTLCENIYSAM
jgi:hypothetical protein